MRILSWLQVLLGPRQPDFLPSRAVHFIRWKDISLDGTLVIDKIITEQHETFGARTD